MVAVVRGPLPRLPSTRPAKSLRYTPVQTDSGSASTASTDVGSMAPNGVIAGVELAVLATVVVPDTEFVGVAGVVLTTTRPAVDVPVDPDPVGMQAASSALSSPPAAVELLVVPPVEVDASVDETVLVVAAVLATVEPLAPAAAETAADWLAGGSFR